MDFRWIAAIALWTFLSGPAIGPPAGAGVPRREKPKVTQRAPNNSGNRAKTQKTAAKPDNQRRRTQ